MEIDGAAQASDFSPCSGDGSDVDDLAAKHCTNLEVEDVLEAEATAVALEDKDREDSDEYTAFSAGMFKAVLPSLCRGLTSLL
jgi:hypothetical protein